MSSLCKQVAITGAMLSIALLGFLSLPAFAGTILVPGDSDNYEAQKRSSTGVYAASSGLGTGFRVGYGTNFNGSGTFAPGSITTIYFFPLPALGAFESVSSASFSVGRLPDTATSAVTPTFNADLYILGVVDATPAAILDAENYWYNGDTAQAVLPAVAGSTAVGGAVSRVVDNFLVPADFIPNSGTAAATPNSADFTSYIQNLYANPLPNGFTPGTSLLVVRINGDADSPPTSGTQRYFLADHNDATVGSRPLLTLQTIPEPSSMAIAFVVIVALFGYRRSS